MTRARSRTAGGAGTAVVAPAAPIMDAPRPSLAHHLGFTSVRRTDLSTIPAHADENGDIS
ncbi:hypothetical protein ABIC85_000353 [Oerskovia enterophila]